MKRLSNEKGVMIGFDPLSLKVEKMYHEKKTQKIEPQDF